MPNTPAAVAAPLPAPSPLAPMPLAPMPLALAPPALAPLVLTLLALVLLVLMPLGGCTLIDQRTFNPDAGKPPAVAAAAPAPAPPPAGPAALLTVRFDRPAPVEPSVRQAVALARARKRDVAFDVVAVVPAAEEAAVRAGGEEAARVARAITAQGVPAARVSVQARVEPAAPGREVRVFVR